MKKPTDKSSTKTLTPAKKPAKAAVKKTAPAPAPAAKAVVPKAVVTTIIANIDVGFGRSLYLRGEGPGLSWEKGVPMDCAGSDRWQATLPGESAQPILFKVLIDDSIWCAGSDFTVAAGDTVTVAPIF